MLLSPGCPARPKSQEIWLYNNEIIVWSCSTFSRCYLKRREQLRLGCLLCYPSDVGPAVLGTSWPGMLSVLVGSGLKTLNPR